MYTTADALASPSKFGRIFGGSIMSTLRLRRFLSASTLRAIAPPRLVQFLVPHQEFLLSRGLRLPLFGFEDRLEYDLLIRILIEADHAAPAELFEALYLVEELATPEGMDSLLERAGQVQLPVEQDVSPADLAVQVWLLAPDILQRVHAGQCVYRRRSFEHYQTKQSVVPPVQFQAAHQAAMERDLNSWFQARRRGGGARLFWYDRPDGKWFLVRHGDVFRREEALEGEISRPLHYRPLRYDVVVFHQELRELRINARSKHDRRHYRRQFGKHLFGNEEFFPGEDKYTLEPLRTQGKASLVCVDVEGIESVQLREIQLYTDGRRPGVTAHKVMGVFEYLEERGQTIAPDARVISAIFQFKFADSRTPRSVTIKPSNVALYTRDSDSVLVERWLAKRGFLEAEECDDDSVDTPIVAGA